MLDEKAARSLEPALNCRAALLSPSTGILDSHAFLLALRGEAESHGATLAFAAPFRSGVARPDGFQLFFDDPARTSLTVARHRRPRGSHDLTLKKLESASPLC